MNLAMAAEYACTTLGRLPVRVWLAGCQGAAGRSRPSQPSPTVRIWERHLVEKAPVSRRLVAIKGTQSCTEMARSRIGKCASCQSRVCSSARLHCSQRSTLCGPLFWTSTGAASQPIQLGDNRVPLLRATRDQGAPDRVPCFRRVFLSIKAIRSPRTCRSKV
jgi:hypothetical protein